MSSSSSLSTSAGDSGSPSPDDCVRLCLDAADDRPETALDAVDQIEQIESISPATAMALIDLFQNDAAAATRNTAALALAKLTGPVSNELQVQVTKLLAIESEASIRETLIQAIAMMIHSMSPANLDLASKQLHKSVTSQTRQPSVRESRIAELAIKRIDSINRHRVAMNSADHDSTREAG